MPGEQGGGAGEGRQIPGRAVQPERRGETALPDGPAIKGRNTPARLPPRFPAPGKCTSHLGFGLAFDPQYMHLPPCALYNSRFIFSGHFFRVRVGSSNNSIVILSKCSFALLILAELLTLECRKSMPSRWPATGGARLMAAGRNAVTCHSSNTPRLTSSSELPTYTVADQQPHDAAPEPHRGSFPASTQRNPLDSLSASPWPQAQAFRAPTRRLPSTLWPQNRSRENESRPHELQHDSVDRTPRP